MEKSTYLENLRAGYLQTGAMFAQFAEPGAGGEERLRAQVGYLAELYEAMQGADSIRLYGLEVTGERPLPHDAARFLTQSGGAYDLEFSSSPRLLEFLADRGRVLAQLAGHQQIMPAYADLLCFFSHRDSIPFTWYTRDARLLYYAKATKGMDRRASSELKKFLKAHPGGCVLSITMESMRSNVIIFPGAESAEYVWHSLTTIACNDYER
jgi:hypothetical protein